MKTNRLRVIALTSYVFNFRNVSGFSSRSMVVNHNPMNRLFPRTFMSTIEETGALTVSSPNNDESNGVKKENRISQEEKRIEVGGKMLKVSENGIIELQTPDEYAALIAGNYDKIMLIKFFSPYCRACKGLRPKYIALAKDERLEKLPVVFAEMDVMKYRSFAKNLGISSLPSVSFHIGKEGLYENFPCAPTKVKVLKKKLANLVNQCVDKKTLKLKDTEVIVVLYEN